MGPVLVFGHRNPDNDSVCSAVAYAHLKNLTDPDRVYVPARLGPVPPESAWVFGRYHIELPEELEHVRTRVRDVMTEDVACVTPGTTMLDAGRLMRDKGVRALPVVADGVVRGLVNEAILAQRYLDETEIRGFGGVPVTVGRLASVLDGRVVVGSAETRLTGAVLIGAMEPETMRGHLKPGDTLIVGDRRRTQPMALEAGVACLVLTGDAGPGPEVVQAAGEHGACVIVTPHDTFATARLIDLSAAVADVMDTVVLMVEPDTLLSEAAEDILGSSHREAIVVDEERRLVGMLTRTNLARGLRRQVVLVDHNEVAQSAAGVEEAQVIEIVDHHRVGDVQTPGPILFLNMPVGATATIVASRYHELGVTPPEGIAALMLAAILSDTVLLKSPTTTEADRDSAAALARIVRVDAVQFGMELFRVRSAGEHFSAERLVNADLKEYHVGDTRVAVGQIETVDAREVMMHAGELAGALKRACDTRAADVALLMVTDVVREGSEILAVGRTRFVERALGIALEDGSAWMPGVLSRKKQIAPRLVGAASE